MEEEETDSGAKRIQPPRCTEELAAGDGGVCASSHAGAACAVEAEGTHAHVQRRNLYLDEELLAGFSKEEERVAYDFFSFSFFLFVRKKMRGNTVLAFTMSFYGALCSLQL